MIKRRTFFRLLGVAAMSLSALLSNATERTKCPDGCPVKKPTRARLNPEYAKARFELLFFREKGNKEIFPVWIERDQPEVLKTLANYHWRIVHIVYPLRANDLSEPIITICPYVAE